MFLTGRQNLGTSCDANILLSAGFAAVVTPYFPERNIGIFSPMDYGGGGWRVVLVAVVAFSSIVLFLINTT